MEKEECIFQTGLYIQVYFMMEFHTVKAGLSAIKEFIMRAKFLMVKRWE